LNIHPKNESSDAAEDVVTEENLLLQMNLFFSGANDKSSVGGVYLLLGVIFFPHRRYFFLHKRTGKF
jgi:hypothetical protein